MGSFALQARQGINLADEGFLWYGVQQTVHGQVPLRDFQAYDPGRYYWSAAWALLFGKGLVALRFAEAAFQIIGLFVGLLVASRIVRGWTALAAIALMFLLWMFPSHKLFDHTLLLCGLWIALRLIEEPSPGRIFTAGVLIGLYFLFGRNHALYNFLAQASLMIFLWCKSRLTVSLPQLLGKWIMGIMVGLIPLLVLFVCVSGFASSYVESIQSILHHGTNLFLPIPWPWQVTPITNLLTARRFLLGIFLLGLPLFYLGAIATAFFVPSQTIRDRAVFVACAFLGLFYLHHAFSRADFSHLAQVIHPFLLGALALPVTFAESKSYRWTLIAALTAIALVVVGPQTPLFQRLASTAPWERVKIGNTIFVPPNVNRQIVCVQKFAAENIPPRDGVLIAPFTPAFYPILGHKSPLWDLAFYFHATEERQKEMIHNLEEKNVNWAIISDTPPDKREDLRFSATHEFVWQYLTKNFEPVEISCLPPSMQVLRRNQP